MPGDGPPGGWMHTGRDAFFHGVYAYIAEGVAFAGRVLMNDPSYGDMARQALAEQLAHHEILAAGQRIGYTLRGGNALLAEIAAFDEREEPAAAAAR